LKIPDVNILLSLVDENSLNHSRVRAWWEEAMSSDEPIGFAWVALLGFLRISTSTPAFPNPLSPELALAIIDQWLSAATSVVIQPTERHAEILRDLITSVGTAGNLTTDAHIAALAIEYDAEVCSADRDFGRFPGLRWLNPLDQVS
jgi:toxin-antitoxin system PIN domain toxin